MLSSEAGQRAVEEYLDTCQLGYRWHVLERGRRGADNRQRYVAVLSQPTAVKPVPDAVVRVNFRVSPDLSGQPAVEYKVENENMIWRTGGGRSVLTDAVIDRVIERKRKLAEELDMGDAFTRTRLMAPEAVTEAASAADPAPAPEDAPAADGAADLSTEDPSELEERLASLFRDADRDHGGTLSHAEFAALMRDAGLGLDDDQLFYLLAQADEDGDGALSYREFARLGAEMVLAMRAHQEAESAADAQEREAEAQARMALAEMDAAGALEGLDSALADGEGGRVELSALPDALASPRVGLAPGEVRMVMAALQGSAGDTVDVADVRSAVLQAKQAAARARTQAGTLSEAGDRILSLLREADEEGQGTLPTSAVAAALGSDSRLMLSRPQVMVLIAQCGEAARREGGGVDVEQFAREAAAAVDRMLSPSAVRARALLLQRAEVQPVELLSGRERADVEKELTSLFRKHDVDGNGVLDAGEFRRCLATLPLSLSLGQVDALMLSADTDADGAIDYNEFIGVAYHSLLHLIREAVLSTLMPDVGTSVGDVEAEAEARQRAVVKIQATQRGKAVRKQWERPAA